MRVQSWRVFCVALAVATIAAVGCSRAEGALPATSTTVQVTAAGNAGSAQRPAPPTTRLASPMPPPYQVAPGEPGAATKVVATRFVEAALSCDDERRAEWEALLRFGTPAEVIAERVNSVCGAATEATAEVLYPQMGGLTADRAAVMVVVRHARLEGGELAEVTRTVDVRVDRIDGAWKVVDLASVGGAAPVPAAPPPSAPVSELLANDRVEFADSARWDLAAGRVDGRIVDLLNFLGTRFRLSVAVLATGHPAEVFGTTSQSNHTAGRGVDIWAVDGSSVFDQRTDPLSAARAIVDLALAIGISEVGSPWDPDGPGGAAFTNDLHQDHLHLAFDD